MQQCLEEGLSPLFLSEFSPQFAIMKRSDYEEWTDERDLERYSGRQCSEMVLVTLAFCSLLGLGLLLKSDLVSSPWGEITTKPSEDSSELDTTSPEEDDHRRRLLLAGGALLIVSFVVCLYSMCRLGLCCHRTYRNGMRSGRGSIQLIAATDLPPSYEALTNSKNIQPPSPPPPYCTVLIFNEKRESSARIQEAG